MEGERKPSKTVHAGRAAAGGNSDPAGAVWRRFAAAIPSRESIDADLGRKSLSSKVDHPFVMQFSQITQAPIRAGRWFGGLTAAVFKRVFAHNVTGHASQFAYNAFLATVPFLFVLVAVVGLAGSENFYDDLIANFGNEIPDSIEGVLEPALRQATGNARTSIIALVIGVIAGLYVVSNVMVTLMGALDNAYGVRHRPWLRGRIVAFALAGGMSVLAIITTVALVGGADFIDGAAKFVGIDSDNAIVEFAKQSIFLFGLGALVFLTLILYRFGPNTKVHRFTEILPGALVAVGAWLGTSRLFRLFVDNFGEYQNVYGFLATFVVYLWYLYMSGIVLLLGAELNGELAKRRAVRDALKTREELIAGPATADTLADMTAQFGTAPFAPVPSPEAETVGDDSTAEQTEALPRTGG
jgi:membrane protein